MTFLEEIRSLIPTKSSKIQKMIDEFKEYVRNTAIIGLHEQFLCLVYSNDSDISYLESPYREVLDFFITEGFSYKFSSPSPGVREVYITW